MRSPIVRMVVLPAFAVLDSTFHVEGEVYIGDTEVARIDEAWGDYRGQRGWWMGGAFLRLIGEADAARLNAAMIAEAKKGSVGRLIDHVRAWR